VKVEVLHKAFTAFYFLAKEQIANSKAGCLLQLVEKLGAHDIKYFHHRSSTSIREMIVTQIIEKVKNTNFFGLLIDDLTDIAVMEQMITFIQYFNFETSQVETKFLFIDDLLKESTSADAETIYNVLIKNIEEFQLPLGKLKGLVTDGAAVMVGKNNGLAAKLKAVNPSIITVHCICHRLALACTDSNVALKYIDEVQLIVTQLWKLFEYSPKKMAAYLKCQQSIKNIVLGESNKNIICKKLKKACKTRWLSFDNA
ncbi:zinc finger protein 862-like, partial [Anneissia japonica]|uniref:zinc finger protein 862-like n=1 Tax=Anneissia japonica TaxID=1529436 RepID=UPI0014254D49